MAEAQELPTLPPDDDDRVAGLVARLERAEALVVELSERVESLSKDVARAEARAEEAEKEAARARTDADANEERIEDLEESASSNGGGEVGTRGISREEAEQIVEDLQKGDELFPYKVSAFPAGSGGDQSDIWVLLPKDDLSGDVKDSLGGAFGCAHIGSSNSPKADMNEAPWPTYGGSQSESWPFIHFAWHRVGETMQDGIVYAEFKVPVPDPDASDSDEPVEGPYLSKVKIVNSMKWQSMCKDTWKPEADDPDDDNEVTRLIPLAHVSNGMVTQMQFGNPFVDAGGAGAAAQVLLDTDVTPDEGVYEPGESVNRYEESDSDSDEDSAGKPVQLRQFYDTTDTQAVQGIGETTTGDEALPDATVMHVLLRQYKDKAGTGGSNIRPKLVYAPADNGPFWVRGGEHTVNYGASIAIGNKDDGYVTISTTT